MESFWNALPTFQGFGMVLLYSVIAILALAITGAGLAFIVWLFIRAPRQAAPISATNPGVNPPAVTPVVVVRPPGYISWWRLDKHLIKVAKDNKKAATVVWFVLLLYALMLAFFPESRDFLLSSLGVGLLLLAIVGYMTFVIIKAVFWEGSRFTAIIMMLLLIAVLDMGIMRNVPPDQRTEFYSRLTGWIPSWSGNGQSFREALVPPPPPGPRTGVTLTAVLGPQPIELNPGGSYHIRWDEVDTRQCVNIFDPSNRFVGSDCNGDLNLKEVRAAKFASARGDIVRINYVLTPRWNE